MPLKPFPHGLVIELEAQPGDADAASHGGNGHGPGLGKGVLPCLDEPHIERVHQGIMHDI